MCLTRKLAELFGGQISCKSEYGKESTFTLIFARGSHPRNKLKEGLSSKNGG